ncbi:zinc uptake protein ZrgA [Halocynthiibacter styelae]|uniref:DUF2796 domain-containing protein n=1 Tax=Halocynthiibacter styelae TaxID=2761955 RepID=A0A8J7LQD7_9RHOB|nr:DUF2796 domain-containing protein [Paenihalocynthiibacter styelae]MBI1494981.1 DUF2796 domain-containing protein [Paenihalocynthiibacter styelae]
MRQTFPLIIALAATPAFAQEARQMDAHEHGTGRLNIAAEGNTVAMELHAPGADIVGFEYAPESDADQAKVAEAVEALEAPLDLFVLSEAAGCRVTETYAALELEGEDAHEDHEAHEEEHDHEEGHESHDHEEDHDDHEVHAAEAGHSEFHAEYSLTCENPSALTGIEFAYFAQFENALELEVQVVTASGAHAFEVTRDAPLLALEGLF